MGTTRYQIGTGSFSFSLTAVFAGGHAGMGFLFPLIGEVMGKALAVGFLLIYGGVIVAAIVGVVAALRQRLQEIEGGEEEDAKQY